MTKGLEEIDDILDPVEVPSDVEPELVDILPRGYLSPSQIGAFLKCGHAWKLAYVDGKPRKTSARMFQGVFVHEATEAVLKERLSTGTLPPQAMATDAFSDAFNKSKKLIEDWEGESEGAVKDLGIKCTKTYYDKAAPVSTPVEVETTFTTIIKSEDGTLKVPVLGRIDSKQVQVASEEDYQEVRQALINNPKDKIKRPLRIHDLKIVTDKWSEDDLTNDLQFTIYAGAEHIPDVQVDQVVKGRAKYPQPRYERLTGIVTPEQVQHAQKVVEGVARSIAAGVFPMTSPDNWWCSAKWCSMWRHCRGKGK